MEYNSEKSRFYLHIGNPKTGSTYLQKKVFPKLENIKYCNKPKYNILQEYRNQKTTFGRFMRSSPVVWKDFGDKLLNNLGINSSEKSDILVSDEHIVEANDPFRIAQHLNEFKQQISKTHDLKILIIIRRQDEWISSCYAEVSNTHRRVSQKHFEEYVLSRIDPYSACIDGVGIRLDYYTLIQKIQNVLGKDSVTVLPYELLKSDPSFFTKECCKAINREVPSSLSFASENVRSSGLNTWKLRPMSNTYKPKIELRPHRFFKAILGKSVIYFPELSNISRAKEITLTKELSCLILERYKSENKKLDNVFNLGLKDFGYYQ